MPRTKIKRDKPDAGQASLADDAFRALASYATGRDMALRIQVTEAGREVAALDIPPSTANLIRDLLRQLALGKAVAVVAEDAEITTQQAADLLNVSRPYVVGLVEKGEVPARLVGRQRRLLLGDVLAYRRVSKGSARAALEEMVAISQDLDLE